MEDLAAIVLRAAVTLAALIALIRVLGLRSLSKLSAFDFAVTVATGSILAASTVNPDKTIWHGVVALTALFLLQGAISFFRQRGHLGRVVDNEPLLIMEDGEIIRSALTRSGLTEDDLMSKLREANALDIRRVRAVVFETTGDVNVMHGDADADSVARLLAGVRRA